MVAAVNRLWRVWLLMLVAIGALVAQVSTAHAATASANIKAGSLTISPAAVTISYNVTRQSRGKALNSNFTVTVTDATGTKAGWQILAATARTTSPQSDFPIDDHAIVDFDVPAAGGTWPDPTCPCGVVGTAYSTILQTPARTGMGWSRVRFQTEFDVPSDAEPGTYTTTLALIVDPPGTIAPMPPAKRPSVSPAPGGAPGTSPNGRPAGTADAAPASAGNPAPAPNARPLLPDSAIVAAGGSGSTSQATTNQTTTSSAPSVTAAQSAQTATVTTNSAAGAAPSATAAAPSASAAAPAASMNSGATATPVANPASATTSGQQPDSSATNVPAANTAQANPTQAPLQAVSAPSGSATTPALPAMASAPAVTMSGETVNAQTAFVVDTQDRAANWKLQATIGTSDPATDQPASAIAMNVDILTGDGAAPVSAQAWTLPFVTGPGALVNVAVPQGIGRATLLLNTQVHAPGGDPAQLAGTILTITIVTGP